MSATGPDVLDHDDQIANIHVTSQRVSELMEMLRVTLNADHPDHERDAELQRLLLRSAEHLGEIHRSLGRVQAIERFLAGPPRPPLRVA